MGIKLVRIDDRLIHGQVASTWINDYKIDQVLIINDKVVNDPVQKSVAGLAAPAHVKVMVFGVEQFINVLKTTPIKKDTMLLFTTSIDVLRAIKGGLDIKKLNVGGMRFNSHRRKLTVAVSVTPEEEYAFKELIEAGINVEIQMVPKDEMIPMKNVL